MIDEKRFTKQTESLHNLILENRKKLSIAGVEDVESFDEESISLYTDMGMLTVKGDGMHINKLSIDTGEVIIEGRIDSMVYSDNTQSGAGGFFGRLFK